VRSFRQRITPPACHVISTKNQTLRPQQRLCFQRGWDLGRCLSSFATTLKALQTAAAIERVNKRRSLLGTLSVLLLRGYRFPRGGVNSQKHGSPAENLTFMFRVRLELGYVRAVRRSLGGRRDVRGGPLLPGAALAARP